MRSAQRCRLNKEYDLYASRWGAEEAEIGCRLTNMETEPTCPLAVTSKTR